MKDFGSREDRARVPTKGIRCRLRTELKKLGITNKFRTDEMRNKDLLVISKEFFELPITEFEDRKVKFYLRRKVINI